MMYMYNFNSIWPIKYPIMVVNCVHVYDKKSDCCYIAFFLLLLFNENILITTLSVSTHLEYLRFEASVPPPAVSLYCRHPPPSPATDHTQTWHTTIYSVIHYRFNQQNAFLRIFNFHILQYSSLQQVMSF